MKKVTKTTKTILIVGALGTLPGFLYTSTPYTSASGVNCPAPNGNRQPRGCEAAQRNLAGDTWIALDLVGFTTLGVILKVRRRHKPWPAPLPWQRIG